MKLPKEVKRYCPYCKKHTAQAVTTAKQRARSATHPMSRWGNARTKLRSYRSGFGNLGRFSKKGVKDRKMKAKITKRIAVLYVCNVCKKGKVNKKSRRVSRIVIGEKVAK